MKRISDEQIEIEREAYAVESRKIWEKVMSRERKLKLYSELKSVYERIADAQLSADKEVLREVFERIEKEVFCVDRAGYIDLQPNASENWKKLLGGPEGER